MQHNIYLYETIYHLVYDDTLTCFRTNNMAMHNNIIKIHKGVDNSIKFRVYNRDRKPQAIDHRSVRVRIFDPSSKEVIIERYADHLAEKGLVELKILEPDLSDISEGYYKMVITSGEELVPGLADQIIQTPFYSDENENAVLNVEITGQAHVEPKPTYKITEWVPHNTEQRPNVYYSSAVPAGRIHSYTKSIHTIAMHFENYTGKIEFYGSLEDVPGTNLNGFFPIQTSTGTNVIEVENYTGIVPVVLQINCMWFRFVREDSSLNSGQIKKIEVRN